MKFHFVCVIDTERDGGERGRGLTRKPVCQVDGLAATERSSAQAEGKACTKPSAAGPSQV
jgi:hypothetical protein